MHVCSVVLPINEIYSWVSVYRMTAFVHFLYNNFLLPWSALFIGTSFKNSRWIRLTVVQNNLVLAAANRKDIIKAE